MSVFRAAAGLFLVLVLVPQRAGANAGVPMVAVNAPLLLVALLPVFVIERALLARALSRPPHELGKAIAVSNVVSTLAGYPLSWLALLVIESIAPPSDLLSLSVWFLPGRELSNPAVGHLGVLLALAAAYLLTCPIEYVVLLRMLRGTAPGQLWPLVWRVNAASYTIPVVIYGGFQLLP